MGENEFDTNIDNYTIEDLLDILNLSVDYDEEQVKKVTVDWHPDELPPNSYPIGSYPIDQLDNKQLDKLSLACTSLMKRGIDFYTDWYWSPHMHFANRVRLPFRHQGDIVGYTARWVLEHRPEGMPKYYLKSPKNFVFNF